MTDSTSSAPGRERMQTGSPPDRWLIPSEVFVALEGEGLQMKAVP
jgi:hypothetical protein